MLTCCSDWMAETKLGIGACRILLVTTYIRAQDFADNKPASFENDQKREYITPSFLPPCQQTRTLTATSSSTLNYASVTCKTNRIICRKDVRTLTGSRGMGRRVGQGTDEVAPNRFRFSEEGELDGIVRRTISRQTNAGL